MVQRLEGKVALVTGGARGIGLATARAFAREGARVVIADLNAAGAKEAAASLGQDALGLGADVADPASVTTMIAAIIKARGRIDILFNNAGIGANTPFL
jgi:NAD(P)-dependent dehydrogenase (short-subunit alcohol dehydrogenase family)